MTHQMTLWDEPFTAIKAKTKTVEMRLNDERRRLISVDDVIVFEHIKTKETLTARVIETKAYQDFEALYRAYSPLEIGYNVDEEARPEDMLRYYTKEAITKVGVLAIRIAVIDA